MSTIELIRNATGRVNIEFIRNTTEGGISTIELIGSTTEGECQQ